MDGSATRRDSDRADPNPQRRRQRGLYRQHAAGADRARFGSGQCRRLLLNKSTPVQRLTLSAGGRYDWFNTNTELSPLPSPVLLPAYQKASNIDRTAPTGSFGLVYRLLPTLDLLANVQNRVSPTDQRGAVQLDGNPNSQSEPVAGDRADLRRRLSRQREQRDLEGDGIRQLLQELDPGGAGGIQQLAAVHPEPERRRRREFRASSSRSVGR